MNDRNEELHHSHGRSRRKPSSQGEEITRSLSSGNRKDPRETRKKIKTKAQKTRRRIIAMIIAECLTLTAIFGYAFFARKLTMMPRPDVDKTYVKNDDLQVEDLEKMKEILQRSENVLGESDAFIACDLEFHLALADASHNAMYSIMMQVCRNVIGESLSDILIKGTEAEQEMRYQRILDVHKETYIAIKNQHGAEAARLLTIHLTNAESDFVGRKY